VLGKGDIAANPPFGRSPSPQCQQSAVVSEGWATSIPGHRASQKQTVNAHGVVVRQGPAPIDCQEDRGAKRSCDAVPLRFMDSTDEDVGTLAVSYLSTPPSCCVDWLKQNKGSPRMPVSASVDGRNKGTKQSWLHGCGSHGDAGGTRLERCQADSSCLARALRSRRTRGLGEPFTSPAHCPHRLQAGVEAQCWRCDERKPYWGARRLELELRRNGVVPCSASGKC
jgi:hypothetical protein